MEIPRWSECTQDRDHLMRKKQPLFEPAVSRDMTWTSTRLVMHIGARCLDLRVMSCLCCKLLELWRRNRAWPFKIACGHWLAGWCCCCNSRPRSRTRPVTEIKMKPTRFLLPCQSSSPVRRFSQHFDMIWLYAHNTAGCSQSACHIIHVTHTEACPVCLTLMFDVRYFYLPLPTQLCALLNELTVCPAVKYFYFCLTFVCSTVQQHLWEWVTVL